MNSPYSAKSANRIIYIYYKVGARCMRLPTKHPAPEPFACLAVLVSSPQHDRPITRGRRKPTSSAAWGTATGQRYRVLTFKEPVNELRPAWKSNCKTSLCTKQDRNVWNIVIVPESLKLAWHVSLKPCTTMENINEHITHMSGGSKRPIL